MCNQRILLWQRGVQAFLGLLVFTGAMVAGQELQDEPIRVLILDGQNNHEWRTTTPILQRILESSGLFQVDVATSPAAGEAMTRFHPRFADYHVVLSNYNGQPWLAETRDEFTNFVRDGGGFVCVHAANNAFPDWPEYNQMIGLGGWGGRTEQAGPYVFLDSERKPVRDTSPGPGGSHGPEHEFEVVIRDPDHPITRGLPRTFRHTQDELYDRLRGPAENMQILATAFAAKKYGGLDRHEPVVLTLAYGEGRVFHTALGHADHSMNCVGFVTLLQRGTEWAATGKVTLPVPENFPTSAASQRWWENGGGGP